MAAERRSIKLIGCGGIGGHLAPALCRYLHSERSPAHVVLVDGDEYEPRNQARMHFRAFGNKAVVTARELATLFGDVLTIEPAPEYVSAANVGTLIEDGDLVFLAVDNHATRHLVDERCAALDDVTVLSGGNDGIEEGRMGTYGNVQIARRQAGAWRAGPLGRFHPEIREPRDELPKGPGCAELAHGAAPQLLFTNLAVASAMLSAFWALERGPAGYDEVYVDIEKNRVVPVRFAPP